MDRSNGPIGMTFPMDMNGFHHSSELEKGFQKKPIVAFTNSTVFILDFNI